MGLTLLCTVVFFHYDYYHYSYYCSYDITAPGPPPLVPEENLWRLVERIFMD